MSDIKQKIQKLFALAGSSNESEAKRALAKAQELMILHGIEDFKEEYQDAAVERRIYFKSKAIPQAIKLFYGALSQEYRCKTYTSDYFMIIVGASEEEIDCCISAIDYAILSCQTCWKKYWASLTHHNLRNRAKGKKAYLWGFVYGIAANNKHHREESNLPALVVPAIIDEHVENKYKVRSKAHPLDKEPADNYSEYAYKGFIDGKTQTIKKSISGGEA